MEATAEKALIELESLDAHQLPELQGWREKQLTIVDENPFIKIDNHKTYEEAKKHRTALVTARTTIEKQEKTIASKLREFRTKVGEVSTELIAITLPHEEKQQEEVKRYEEEREAERLEKERQERARKAALKKKVDDFYDGWKESIKVMQHKDLQEVERKMHMEEVTLRDQELEEFELDLEEKSRLLTDQFEERKEFLVHREAQRKEDERLAAERKKLEEQRQKDLEAFKKAEAEEQKKRKAEEDRLAAERKKLQEERDRLEAEKRAREEEALRIKQEEERKRREEEARQRAEALKIVSAKRE